MKKNLRKFKGWVLWEVLLAIVLVLIICGGGAYLASNMIVNGKNAKAASETAVIGAAISVYNVEIGAGSVEPTYPASLNNLTTAQGQYGPWLNSIPSDPWGNSYSYDKNTTKGGYIVWSKGSNGVNESSLAGGLGGDDIGFIGK